MKRTCSTSLIALGAVVLIGCAAPRAGIPAGCPHAKGRAAEPEAVSLLGRALYALPPGPKRAKLENDLGAARALLAAHRADGSSGDAANDHAAKIVWVGRRLGYLWQINEAIDVYTDGIKIYPDYAPFYRHRGHRYISLRQFDKAIADLEHAARLIDGKPDEIEPDGMPNAKDIPLTSTGFNVWYHLGLARYYTADYEGALKAFEKTLSFTRGYDDNLVAVTDWMYMILRRLGRDGAAASLLDPITPEMEMIENMAYHRRLLMYKGLLGPSDLLDSRTDERRTEGDGEASQEQVTELDLATLGYGVGQWYRANGETEKAVEVFERIVAGPYWPAFGVIAAEADLARMRRK